MKSAVERKGPRVAFPRVRTLQEILEVVLSRVLLFSLDLIGF